MFKTSVASVLFFLCLPLLTACADRAETLSSENLVVLEGATLIDGTGSAPLPNAVIVMDGDRIARVGQVGDFVYLSDARVIPMEGRFIIPGLIDVHTHIQTPIHKEVMQMLLAYGITTVRVPGGTDIGVQARGMVARGELLGPRLFTGGRLIDGKGSDNFVALNEEEVREEVRRQHQNGVNLIKLYGLLPPDLTANAIDEAHKLDLPVVGHVSRTSWREAAERGIDGLTHGAPVEELIGISHRQAQAKRHDISLPEFEEEYRGWKFMLSMREDDTTRTGQRIRDMIDINGPEVASFVQVLLKNNVLVDPTLVTDESLTHADEVERVLSHLDPHRTPASVTEFLWGEDWESGHRIVQGEFGDLLLSMKPLFNLNKELTLKFHKAGIVLGAGSDVGMPWMTPGASLHRELELLVESGIPVKDVLQIATRNGSQFVYQQDDIGTIEPGKLADLVVLTANPLEDIRNTRKIETVIKAGKQYDPDALFEALNPSD